MVIACRRRWSWRFCFYCGAVLVASSLESLHVSSFDTDMLELQVPLTPAVNQGSVDPFSLRLPQTTRTSHTSMTLPLPSTPAASTSSSFSRPSSLSLHLPPASKPTTIPEGKTLHLFPPAQRSAVDVSSLPTGGQSAAYNVVPRPHYKSMPGGHSVSRFLHCVHCKLLMDRLPCCRWLSTHSSTTFVRTSN